MGVLAGGAGPKVQGPPCFSGARLCGLDVNPVILVIAQRLFRDLGLDNLELAVADAEVSLPFRPGSVDFFFATSVVEHLGEQQASVGQWGQVLSRDSILYFTVPNRYTLHPEPHFNCRGVGFVPRPWQKRYVGRRLGVPAKNVATVWSYTSGDLARLLCPAFSADLLADLPAHVPAASFFGKVVTKLVQPLGVNYHQCLVRRTPDAALAPGLRAGSRWDRLSAGAPCGACGFCRAAAPRGLPLRSVAGFHCLAGNANPKRKRGNGLVPIIGIMRQCSDARFRR